jgi:hypothetical protein
MLREPLAESVADSDEPVSCHLAHFPFVPTRGSTLSGRHCHET